jgi:hypothetical protein
MLRAGRLLGSVGGSGCREKALVMDVSAIDVHRLLIAPRGQDEQRLDHKAECNAGSDPNRPTYAEDQDGGEGSV